ncbi:SPOR domain-containing protein [Roseovarius aestuarii]|nr:SPOR domain-containing protein [Roseovarius aestuarii]
MAQISANRPMGGPDQVSPDQFTALTKASYVLGSIVSVSLIIGLGVWGYKLLVRDVSGVPIIRAAEGPARVEPTKPGGQQSENQGLSVNDVAAIGIAGDAPDELILAPAPLDLSDEDAPQQMLAQTSVPAAPAVPQQGTAPTGLVGQPDVIQSPNAVEIPAPRTEEEANAAMLALADALSAGVEPLGDVEPAPEASGEADASVQTAAVAPDQIIGGLGRSLRPKTRPSNLSNIRPTAAVAGTSATGADGTKEIAADSIPTGTRLAQLGAYASEDIARQEWVRLSGQFEEYLTGKNRVIQRATSGGRTFYRLRAVGFEDLADARRFCSALVAERAECIPVVTR